MSERVRTGYMCSTEFAHHLEHDRNGAEVYPSEAALRAASPCTDPAANSRCGIYKVEVKVVDVVQEEKIP